MASFGTDTFASYFSNAICTDSNSQFSFQLKPTPLIEDSSETNSLNYLDPSFCFNDSLFLQQEPSLYFPNKPTTKINCQELIFPNQSSNASNSRATVSRKKPVIFKPKSNILKENIPKSKGCGCKTSHCLRGYCKCLSKRGFCDETCGCIDCFNNTEHKTERDLVLRKTEEILGKSLGQKFKLTKSGDKVNSEGCKCKTGCISKLCACRGNGLGCSSMCRCNSCKNGFLELEPEEVKRLFQPSLRNKETIVIQTLDSSTKQEIRTQVEGRSTVFFCQNTIAKRALVVNDRFY